jgi:tripartite-type tricarboxylate transporter receptor subunit TctC
MPDNPVGRYLSKRRLLMLTRRKTLQFAASAVAMPFVSTVGWAQAYPNKPVKILSGFPPGGLADLSARIPAQVLSERLKQQFIVENRPGAATAIATEAVVRAPPDGYTLLQVSASSSVNQSVYEKLNFNIVTDLAMIAGTITSPLALVAHPSLPANSVQELVAYVKANPDKLGLASFGTGTTSHAAGELFKMMSGISMVHIPYRGSVPMSVDLIAGQILVAFDTVTNTLSHIRAGKLRALAVCSLSRASHLPNVPSMSDFIPGFEANGWNGIAAPKGTPAAIVNKLNTEINAVFAEPAIAAKVNELGAEVFRKSPAEFSAQVTAEVSRWEKVVKFANIKPE